MEVDWLGLLGWDSSVGADETDEEFCWPANKLDSNTPARTRTAIARTTIRIINTGFFESELRFGITGAESPEG